MVGSSRGEETDLVILGVLSWGSGVVLASAEVCNGVDDDGDGLIDEGPVIWGADLDADGHGDAGASGLSTDCSVVLGVPSVDDCDYTDPSVHPGAAEICDGRDQDCDGVVDEGNVCACDLVVGDPTSLQICTDLVTQEAASAECAAIGWSLVSIADANEQDQLATAVSPYKDVFWIGFEDRAQEGVWLWTDGTPTTFTNWRKGEPNDGDGYGDEDCAEIEPAGQWDDQSCSDLQAYVCRISCVLITSYADLDGDGLGDFGNTTSACAIPAGFVGNAQDCDDTDPNQPMVAYLDLDSDGFGDEGSVGCALTTPWVAQAGDCDDGEAAAFPGGIEVCDGIDNDCAGGVDDGDGGPWYVDADGDGYGDAGGPVTTTLCAPPQSAPNDEDCDDTDPDHHPGAVDVAGDAIDADCDGVDGTSPDTDADGLTDAEEAMLGTDPLDPDTDADGLGDLLEVEWGTNPLHADSDRDGIPDATEGNADTDADGIIDALDPDDDGDGIETVDEGDADLDGDGLPNYLDLDADGDGASDASEGLPWALDPGGDGPGIAATGDPVWGFGCRTAGGSGLGLWLLGLTAIGRRSSSPRRSPHVPGSVPVHRRSHR